MSVSIKKHFSHAPVQESIEFKRMFTAVLDDIAALQAASATLTAKLDADSAATGGDSDYAAVVDALQTNNLVA